MCGPIIRGGATPIRPDGIFLTNYKLCSVISGPDQPKDKDQPNDEDQPKDKDKDQCKDNDNDNTN